MSLPSRLQGANPSIQVSSLLSGTLTTPSAKGAFIGAGDFYSIASTTGQAGGITFSNIPSTYKHLELRMSLRDTGSTTGIAEYYIQFNGDTTGANYWKVRFYGDSTTITGQDGSVSSEGIWGTHYPRNGSALTGCSILQINDYQNTNKWKVIHAYGGGGIDGSSMAMGVSWGHWKSTSAITSVTIAPNGSGFYSSNTFALYGIAG
jgi:hypothetical protein